MKVCIVCGLRKALAAFARDASKGDGLHPRCRPCSNAQALAWKAANRVRSAETLRLWRRRNKGRLRQHRQRWFDNRPGYREGRRAVRRQAKARRVGWADSRRVQRYYRLARALRESGVDVHVGHWVPLRGRNVCGLHVADNLCLEMAEDNLRKGARVVPQGDPPAISRARALKFCAPGEAST